VPVNTGLMSEPVGPQFLLTYHIKTVHQALRAELDEGLRGVGLTLPQMAVLAALGHRPGASSAELARAAFVSPQTMGELLAVLELGGLIERTPSPRTARVLRTTLTPAGMQARELGGAVVARVEARLAAVLTTEEQRLLRNILERCAAAFGAVKSPGAVEP
jgi:DNA-binding MarR family transcriptional regulator